MMVGLLLDFVPGFGWSPLYLFLILLLILNAVFTAQYQ